MKLFRTANKNITDECRSFCDIFLANRKATNSVRSLNVTRACWDISISVLAKRFSFVVIVILLHTLVKIVRSHHCLFVCCYLFLLLLFLLQFVVNKDVHKSKFHRSLVVIGKQTNKFNSEEYFLSIWESDPQCIGLEIIIENTFFSNDP